MTRTEKTEMFVVVKVHSGLPAVVEAFLDESTAYKYATELEVGINPEYDEVEVFQRTLCKHLLV